MVFLAGPLSGLIVQPLVGERSFTFCFANTHLSHRRISGFLADNSKSRFGRRRPYMIGGSLLCAFSLLLLGYTRFFSSIFTSPGSAAVRGFPLRHLFVLNRPCYSERHPHGLVSSLGHLLYGLFRKRRSVLLLSLRALSPHNKQYRQWIVRWLWTHSQPPKKLQGTLGQRVCSVWAAWLDISCLSLFQPSNSQLIRDFSGSLDLPRMFPFLGTQELQVLSFLASFFLIALQCITCIFVKEKVLVSTMYVFFISHIGRHFDDSTATTRNEDS
jgi:hypothetical protein